MTEANKIIIRVAESNINGIKTTKNAFLNEMLRFFESPNENKRRDQTRNKLISKRPRERLNRIIMLYIGMLFMEFIRM